MQKKTILIAEDELSIRSVLSRGLTDMGYLVDTIGEGELAWQLICDKNYDIVLLDIRMPGMSGIDICKKLREKEGYKTPVIMLTALGTTDDIVSGLNAGADDYMVKPFRFSELIARIDAILRRIDASRTNSQIVYGDIVLDPISHKVTREGITIGLSTKEFRLFEYLLSHSNEVLSRRDLLRDVWDKDFDTNTNVVDVYVKYLRSKVDDPFTTKLIHTVMGVGYILRR